MIASDKSQLYHFLSIAESWISQYRVDIPQPDFQDDHEPGDQASNGANPAFQSLESLACAIRECEKCDLHSGRKRAVTGVGPKRPTVLVVGDAPGEEEEERGEPFVGDAGRLLDKMLASIGLSRETNCCISNSIKCRPPQNRAPLPAESAACARFLAAEIALLRPMAILAVGRVAAQALLGTEQDIAQLRGQFYDYSEIPVLATYHPSALLRDESLKRPAWEDLKALKAKLEALSTGSGNY
jgi:uracil-DNA glycosylase